MVDVSLHAPPAQPDLELIPVVLNHLCVRVLVGWNDECHACAPAAGGWDSKIKYWDLRTNSSVGEVQLEAKVYAMDTRDQLLVVGTSEQQAAPATNALNSASRPATDRTRKIYCFNLKNPTQPLKVETSPLQYQTRCVAAFPGNAGYLVGSIEGRVGVQNFDGMHPDKQQSYTFKCHRRTLDAQGNVAQSTKQVRSGAAAVTNAFLLVQPQVCLLGAMVRCAAHVHAEVRQLR